MCILVRFLCCYLFVLKASGLICGRVAVDCGRDLQVCRVDSESRDGNNN